MRIEFILHFPSAASLSDGVEIFDASADDPPLYEPPPDYEEVIKLILSGNNLKVSRPAM